MKTIQIIFISLLLGLLMVGCKPDNLVPGSAERFFVRTQGADLAVQVDGNIASKVFVLLLHGGPGGNGWEYNQGTYADILEKEFAMAYLDQRGQGASQGSYAKETLTMQTFSNDILAVVKALKGKYGKDSRVFLAGHSWGGTTGTHALLHTDVQDHLSGWIEMSGAHDIPLLNKETIKMFNFYGPQEVSKGNSVTEWQEILDYIKDIDTLNITSEQGGQLNQYAGKAEEYITDLAVGGDSKRSNPPFPLYTFLSSNFTSNAIYEETENTALTDRLDEIKIPTLLLWGKYDFVVPPALGTSALERISSPDKSLVIFEQSGHSPMDTEPEKFTNAVIDFVKRVK